VDDLISPGSTGPWVDLVLDQIEPSKWLHQGDMLVDIKIPMFKALLDVQDDPTPEIPIDVGTIVVMTQSCDARWDGDETSLGSEEQPESLSTDQT